MMYQDNSRLTISTLLERYLNYGEIFKLLYGANRHLTTSSSEYLCQEQISWRPQALRYPAYQTDAIITNVYEALYEVQLAGRAFGKNLLSYETMQVRNEKTVQTRKTLFSPMGWKRFEVQGSSGSRIT